VAAESAYLIGRAIQLDLPSDRGASNVVFASIRADTANFEGLKYAHCTFANVSFKDCEMRGLEFSNCVFINCYFRRTKINDCKFAGCKFIDCDLGKVDWRASDLKFYTSFVDCYIKYDELRESLPSEGNLKYHLCSNLALEARKAGALRDEGQYRQAGAKAMEAHLWDAAFGSSEFFREKYRGGQRFGAGVSYIISRVRGWLWGYRRSWLVVLRSWAILTLGVFPLTFWICNSGLQRPGRKITGGDYWRASVGNILPGSGLSDVAFVSNPALFWAFIEVLIGLLYAGLIAALIFRAVYDRWR
jgi:hypothetical protein